MSLLYVYPNQNNTLLTWRRESLGGKDYIVAQGVPLVEGVLNGRFVSAEEFGAFTNDWNGVPVVMRHPKENGGSARVPEPDVPIIGRFYSAKLDGARLTGEYWLEADKLDNPDGEMILSRLSAQKPSETSTGYWAESVPSVGNWNGQDFAFVDQNIHPDHIALLPDEIGACSLKDGCGMNRNARQKGGPMSNHNSRNRMQMNIDGSLEQRTGAIYDAFMAAFGGNSTAAAPAEAPWLVSTFEAYVVAKTDGKFYQVGYFVNGDEITFDPREKWQEVLRVEKYVPVQNVTGLTGRAAKLWEEVYQSYIDKDESEERAAKAAWSAVKGAYEKKNGEWIRKNRKDPELLGIASQDLEGLASLAAFVAN